MLRPARPFPPHGGSTYRPPRSTSAPVADPYTGNFTPSRISDIAGNAGYSSNSFADTSRTLPPLMDPSGTPTPVPVRPMTARPPYGNMAHMDPRYDGETLPNEHGDGVQRVQPTPGGFHHAQFQNGQWMLRGRPFDTRAGSTPWDTGGRAIFVMDRNGNLFVSNNAEAGSFHHSTLGNGGPVAAAGELRVENGQLQYVTAASGHYKPTYAQMAQLKGMLESQGIYGVPIYDFKGPYVNPPMFITGR